jgi:hypothetical protein
MSKRDRKEKVNLFDLKPIRNVQWETKENDLVVLLVPKFQNKFLARHVMPRLRAPNFRIDLDKYGSFVWRESDGNTTVLEIAERMREKFGEEFDPKYERVGRFVSQLVHQKFLSLS